MIYTAKSFTKNVKGNIYMNFIYRGLRNVYRSRTRTLVIIIVLSLSISVALAMGFVEKTVSGRLNELQSDIGTQLELRPQGAYGLAHSSSDKNAKYISGELLAQIDSMDHVRSANGYLSTMGDFAGEHLVIMGIEPKARLSIFGGGVGKLKAGELLDSYSDTDSVVLIGEGYAKRHNGRIGDKVFLNNSEVTIVGIFESDTAYGDHGIFTPVGNMQRIFNLEGRVSSIFVDVDSIKNADSVMSQIRNASDAVDIIDKDKPIRDTVIASFGNVRSTSNIGAMLSLAIGSAIVFFTMLLVTRERRKEIGTLKAIGASDMDLIKQFFVETVAISLIAATIGFFITYAGGDIITASFFSDAGNVQSTPKDIRNIGVYESVSGLEASIPKVSFAFDIPGVASAIGMAFMLSLAGMLYPVIQTFRMKPVEAFRNE